MSEEGGLEELDEFFESFAIRSLRLRTNSVSLTTCALRSATSFFKAAFSASSSAIRRLYLFSRVGSTGHSLFYCQQYYRTFVALRFKNILESSMKTGIMHKDCYFFVTGCVAQSFGKFRPDGLNGYKVMEVGSNERTV